MVPCLHGLLDPMVVGIMMFRNVGKYYHTITSSHSRRMETSVSETFCSGIDTWNDRLSGRERRYKRCRWIGDSFHDAMWRGLMLSESGYSAHTFSSLFWEFDPRQLRICEQRDWRILWTCAPLKYFSLRGGVVHRLKFLKHVEPEAGSASAFR